MGVDPVVLQITGDSRQVEDGALFVAVTGDTADGHRFIPAALDRGAVALIGTLPLGDLPAPVQAICASVPYIQVMESRPVLALLAAALHGFPSRDLAVAGITGTDGKTTTSTILESILNAATRSHPQDEVPGDVKDEVGDESTNGAGRTGVITTVAARIRGQEVDTGLHVTTPDAPQVQALLAQMREAGCRYAVVESTSHGLAQDRVTGVAFDVAAVTNITHEHLDYHGTLAAYVAAKARLFRFLFHGPEKASTSRCAVLNGDDPISFPALSQVLREEEDLTGRSVPVRVYGLQPTAGVTGQPCDVFAAGIDHAPDATSFDLHWWGGHFPVGTRLIGEFNVANVLCAATVALSLGVAPEAIQAGVAGLSGVLGRMQRMDVGQPFLAVVDFAHSPASLERALLTLRPLTAGRLIAVFGSAGLRDRAKRRLMGQVAGRLADFSVITAEDPRTEDLDAINQEIAAGVAEHASSDASSDAYADASSDAYAVVPDRGAAIQRAVDMAQPGDVVAAFGKGHERSMCFGVTEYPWDEQEAMLNALRRRMGLPGGDPTLYRLPTAGV